MAAFPLLRLPLLPLKIVLDIMHHDELISFLLCSQKTNEILKTFKMSVSIDTLSSYQKAKLNTFELITLLQLKAESNPRGSLDCFPEIELTIMISDKLQIRIDKSYWEGSSYNYCFPFFIEVMPITNISMIAGTKSTIKIEDIAVSVKIMHKHTMLTFWKDLDIGFITMITYFKKLFNTKIKECCVYGTDSKFSKITDSKFSKNLRAAVGLSQQTIESCVIKYDFNSEDYKFILDNMKPTIRFNQSDYRMLSNDFRHKTSFNSKYFELKPAHWFTFDNLITMNCEEIKLSESSLTNNDICKYLELWMDGKFEKLKKLVVELRQKVKLDDIFTELNNYSQRYTVVQGNENIHIKQHDHVVANISGTAKMIYFDILQIPIQF